MDLEQRYRVSAADLRLDACDPGDVAGFSKADGQALREAAVAHLAELQERLYAEGRRALLVVLQGRDASGKDGIAKHVFGGLNPQGVAVTSFKTPEPHELAHDFLWREQVALPERGSIGVYNRSHYEEVLVTRVHPELLSGRGIDPARAQDAAFWEQRLEDIAAWERHLTRDGTRLVKFHLNISKAEQLERLAARAERPDKQWKFSHGDLRERELWDAYREAYELALRATSSEQEPWYVIPADHKWFARAAVASIVEHHLAAIDPRVPQVSARQRAEMLAAIAALRAAG